MKIIFIALLLVSFLHSDEMQRIESIVEDITKLRGDYEKCQDSLKSKKTIKIDIVKYQKNEDEIRKYQKLFKDERQKNVILKAEVDYMKDTSSNRDKAVKKYKKLLKTKETEITALKKKLFTSSKRTTRVKKVLPVEVCVKAEDTNPFPKLMQKERVQVEADIKEQIQNIEASAFRLKTDSSIFNTPDGKKVVSWKKDTSFTSNQKTTNWVKITGYFIDKKWIKSKQDMWIKLENVFQRK